MPLTPLTLDDFDEHLGCRHGIEATVTTALRTFFTSPPANRTQPVLTQLQAALTTAVPSVTWTVVRVRRAVATFVASEE